MFLMRTSVVVLLPAAVVLPGSGCRSVGPATVTRDRQDYVTAVGDSRNEQLLLNIVKLRYGEAPTFLDVVSVVSGYSLETGVSLNGQFSPQALRGDTFIGGGVAGRFTDRPTISYSPMTDQRFARNLLPGSTGCAHVRDSGRNARRLHLGADRAVDSGTS